MKRSVDARRSKYARERGEMSARKSQNGRFRARKKQRIVSRRGEEKEEEEAEAEEEEKT